MSAFIGVYIYANPMRTESVTARCVPVGNILIGSVSRMRSPKSAHYLQRATQCTRETSPVGLISSPCEMAVGASSFCRN